MQKLIGSILILVAMFYASFTEAIGTDRDLNTAIITAKQITTPPNPASGFQRIYCKADEKCYTLNSAGEETELGSGGAADFKELMTDPSFEELTDEGVCVNCTATLVPSITTTPFNVNRLSLVFSAAGTYTVDKTTGDGFFGLPSNVQCEVSTTNSDIDFAHRSNGANAATVDVDAVAIASGAGATTKVVQALKSNVIGTTSEGFQIIAGSAGTVFLDNCTVSTKEVLSSVGYTTNWESYTPVVSGITISPISYSKWRRVGDSVEIKIQGTVSANAGTELQIGLPSGLVVDDSYNSATDVGRMERGVTSEEHFIALATGGDTYLNSTNRSSGVNNYFVPQNGSALYNATDGFSLSATVKIANWSASFDSISDSAGGSNVRLDTANGYGSTATKIRRFSNQRVNIGSNIEYVDSATDGASFTVKRSGFYFVSYSDSFASTQYMGISLNASSLSTSMVSTPVAEYLTMSYQGSATTPTSASWAGWLWAGDIVRPHTDGAAFSGIQPTFSIVGLLDQINAILKDVVMSPGSSNGKPILCSADISSTGVISNQDGGCFASCTNATTPVCTFTTDFWLVKPKCWHTVQGNIQGGAVSTITDFSGSQLNGSFVPVSGDRTYFCHGVRP